jgi:hypothetical protein
MNERGQMKLIKAVWRRFQENLNAAFESKNEPLFDWYSEGQQTYSCIFQGKPITVVPYIRNCFVKVREGDPRPLGGDSTDPLVRLDGYAIVPLEEYDELAIAVRRKRQGREGSDSL